MYSGAKLSLIENRVGIGGGGRGETPKKRNKNKQTNRLAHRELALVPSLHFRESLKKKKKNVYCFFLFVSFLNG